MVSRVAAAAGLVAAAVAQPNLCVVNFGNSTFNIEPLVGPAAGYWVQDASNNAGSVNYTYVFNFCRNIDPTIPQLSWTTCNNTTPGYPATSPVKSGPGTAFQIANFNVPNQDKCHRLGDLASASTVSYGLINPQDPSKGIYVQYGGGDYCNLFSASRSLRVWIPCTEDAENLPDDELVQESRCQYEIYVPSSYGCPVQCPVVARGDGSKALCGGHGICEFDTVIGNSRCFCNDGYTGSDCMGNLNATSGLSAVGAMLVVVCIFLAMTLAFLGYLWFRIRSLRLDPAAYSALRGGPGEEAEHVTVGGT